MLLRQDEAEGRCLKDLQLWNIVWLQNGRIFLLNRRVMLWIWWALLLFPSTSNIDALCFSDQIDEGFHEYRCHGHLMLWLSFLSPRALMYQRPYIPCPQATRLPLKAAVCWAWELMLICSFCFLFTRPKCHFSDLKSSSELILASLPFQVKHLMTFPGPSLLTLKFSLKF